MRQARETETPRPGETVFEKPAEEGRRGGAVEAMVVIKDSYPHVVRKTC